MSLKSRTLSILAISFSGLTTLGVLTGCGGGSSTSTPPPAISVSLNLSTASLSENATQAFTATVSNDSANAGVTWSIGTGAGALSASTSTSITYTAPATISTTALVTLTATSVSDTSKSASAAITLNPPAGQPTITAVTASCTPISVQISQTSQCTSTVTGTGAFSSTVTWSVGGVAGGNATVGTISAAGVYTAPAAVPTPNPVTVTATSTQDPTKSGSASVTISTGQLSISSLSTTSLVPLTAVVVTTTGVDPNSPISLTFSDGAGFSVTESPIRVDTSGSGMMVVAVPLYVNPTTGVTGPDTMSLVLSQGGQSSGPVTVDIVDLPSVASYGATPGQISHAALIFEAMVIGQRINDLQAVQALPGNTVDTTQAQSALTQMLPPMLNARSDVDSVTATPSMVIPGGVNLSNGSPVQFDQTALDMMDRVNGVFLSQVLTLPAASSQAVGQKRKAKPATSPAAAWLNGIDLVTNLTSYEASMLSTLGSKQSFSSLTISDYATALSNTIGTTVSTAGTFSGNQVLGALGATFSALPTIATSLGNDAAYLQGWATGDTAVMNAAQAEMLAGQKDVWATLAGLAAGLAGNSGLDEVVGEASTTAASTVLDMTALYFQTQQEPNGGGFAPIDLPSVPISTTPPSSPSQGIGMVNGSITVPDQGLTTPQGGFDLCCFNSGDIIGIVDADGNYESFVPLGAANADYSAIVVDATYPLTGTDFATETVDLSGLTSTTPITVPALPTTSTSQPIGTGGASVAYLGASISCTNAGFFDNCTGTVTLNVATAIQNGELTVLMDAGNYDGGNAISAGAVPGTVSVPIAGSLLAGTCTAGTMNTDIQVLDGFANSTNVTIGTSTSVPLIFTCGAGS